MELHCNICSVELLTKKYWSNTSFSHFSFTKISHIIYTKATNSNVSWSTDGTWKYNLNNLDDESHSVLAHMFITAHQARVKPFPFSDGTGLRYTKSK